MAFWAFCGDLDEMRCNEDDVVFGAFLYEQCIIFMNEKENNTRCLYIIDSFPLRAHFAVVFSCVAWNMPMFQGR